MQIFVRDVNGRYQKVNVKPSDVIDKIKEKLRDMLGIPVTEQRLIFGGWQLEDGHTVAECNIKHQSTLHLLLRLRSCDRCYKTICVQILVGKTITLGVNPSNTIDDVRAKIRSHQRLLFDGKPLEDKRRLSDYQIKHEATLHLDLGMQISVTMLNGKAITLDVEPSDTIRNVKAKIQEQKSIIFDGKQLNGQSKLADYNVENGSTLHLDLCPHGGMPIIVKPLPSKTICLTVGPLDTIGDVKAKIQKLQRLIFNGNQLEDGQTLADYDIQQESTLHLDYGLNVYVKTPTGRTTSLDVELSNTVDDVNKRIQDKQRLILDDKELEDELTLADYDIQNDSLHLDLRPGGGESS